MISLTCYAQRLTEVSAMMLTKSTDKPVNTISAVCYEIVKQICCRCAGKPSDHTCYIFGGKETRSSSFSATQNIQAFRGDLTFLEMGITLTEGWWSGPLLQLVKRKTNLARGLCGLPPLACTQDFSVPTEMGFQVKRYSTLGIFFYFIFYKWVCEILCCCDIV